MSIEFRCTQCNKLLRTSDNTAGKQAKCPECGTVLTIPSPGAQAPAAPQAPSPGPAPTPGPAAGSPFGAGAAPAAGPANPYQSPGDYTAAPGQAPPPGAFAPTQIDMGDVFSRTWAIFKDNMLMCIAGWLIVTVINGVVDQVFGFAGTMIGMATGEEAVFVIMLIITRLASILFMVWLSIGMWMFFLRIARGQEAPIGMLFQGGPYYVTVLGAGILFVLIVGVGYALCIVPGVIFALMLSQFYYLIIDRNAGVTESLSLSKEITTGNKLTLFVTYLVAGLLGGLLVICTCGVGALVVFPYMTLLGAVIYLAMTGQATADQLQRSPMA